MTNLRPPSVFISYSHDSPEHAARVLDLANSLRRDGVDAIIDQYLTSPSEGWPAWMDRHIRDDDFVVMVCTETYYRRVVRKEKPGVGLGVAWEGSLIYSHLYRDKVDLTRFVPVLFDGVSYDHIPEVVSSGTSYVVDTPDGYEGLLRRLFHRPQAEIPPIGERPSLPQRSAQWTAAPPATLHGVPELPPHFVPRPELLAGLKDKLLSPNETAIGVTGVSLKVGVQGMGGIGKSVLAAALARDTDVRTAFAAGIYWIALGQTPSLIARQGDLYRLLTGERAAFNDTQTGRTALGEALRGRTCLVILDDVWHLQDIEAFNALGAEARLMLTTRNAAIVKSLGAREHVVERLDRPAAMQLLAETAGVPEALLPPEADAIAEQCGDLPLALAMAGAMIEGQADMWPMVLQALKTADWEQIERDFPDYPYRNVFAAIEASVNALEEDDRERYLDLAVFPEELPIPEAAIKVLWAPLRPLQVRLLLKRLRDRSLASLDGKDRLSLHDLQRDFVVKRAGDLSLRHQRLVDAYCQQCRDGWARGPNDGYFFQHLPGHLAASGHQDELRALLLDYDWLLAKLRSTDAQALVNDCGLVADDPEIRSLQGAIRHSAPALARDVDQLPAQLAGRLRSLDYDGLMDLCNRASSRGPSDDPCLWPKSPSLQPPGGPLTQTLFGHTGAVSGAVVLTDDRRALSWSSDVISIDHTLRLWDLEAGIALRTLEGHTDRVLGAVVLADDRRALSWSGDKTLRLWDLDTGTALHTLEGHTDEVYGAVVLADGQRAMSWSGDETLRLWEMDTGTALNALEGHTHQVYGAVVLADGRRALSWSREKKPRLWNLDDGTALHTLKGHTGKVSGAVVLADGRRALSWSEDETLRLWDLNAGTAFHTLKGHTAPVYGAVMLADGERALSWSEDGTLRLWDLNAGTTLSTLEGHTAPVRGAAVLADGRRALSWSWDKTLRLWDLDAGTDLYTLRGHTSAVICALVLARGTSALSWSWDKALRLWDLDTGTNLNALERHTAPVHGAVMLADGERALSWSSDKTLRLWDLDAGAGPHALRGHTEGVSGAVVLADGRQALSWSWDKTLRLWDLDAGTELHTFKGHIDGVSGAVVLANGQRALSWSGGPNSRDPTLRLWDLDDGTELHTFKGHIDGVSGAVVLADGQRALSWSDGPSSTDPTLRLWDLDDGTDLYTLRGHTGRVSGAAVLADGRRALSWSKDKTLRLWDLDAGTELHTFQGHKGAVSGAAVLADGRRAMSWTGGNSPRLWDLEAGTALFTFEGYAHQVSGAVVYAEGSRALSWSRDGTLQLWDLNTGTVFHTLEGHRGGVSGAIVFADDRRALSWSPSIRSTDPTLRLWDLDDGTALNTLEGHTDRVSGAVVLADGRRALSWSDDWSLILWDLRTGHMVARFIGDAPITFGLAAREDLFVAGSANGAVHILELRESKQQD